MLQSLRDLFRGKDLGIRPDYNLIGIPPVPLSRYERRKEQRAFVKAKRR